MTDIAIDKKSQDTAKCAPIRVTVLGGGSFGTAIANLASRNGCDTRMFIRDAEVAKEMQETRRNQRYLPDFVMDENLSFTGDLEFAVRDRDLILVAIPSSNFRAVLRQVAPFITGQVVVSLTKGIEPR